MRKLWFHLCDWFDWSLIKLRIKRVNCNCEFCTRLRAEKAGRR